MTATLKNRLSPLLLSVIVESGLSVSSLESLRGVKTYLLRRLNETDDTKYLKSILELNFLIL